MWWHWCALLTLATDIKHPEEEEDESNDDDEEEEEDDNAGKRHFVVAQDQGEGSRSISKGTDITRKHSALVCHR